MLNWYPSSESDPSRNNKSKDPSNNLNIHYTILWFCIWDVTTVFVLAVLAECFNVWNCPVYVWCLCNLLLPFHEPPNKSHTPCFTHNYHFSITIKVMLCTIYGSYTCLSTHVCTQCRHRNWLIPLCLLVFHSKQKRWSSEHQSEISSESAGKYSY